MTLPYEMQMHVQEARGAVPIDVRAPDSNSLTRDMDPELRFARSFRPHLPDDVGQTLTRARLLAQGLELTPTASPEEIRRFLYMVSAWGYGTAGYGHARTKRLAMSDGFLDAARAAIEIIQTEDANAPVAAYYILNNSSEKHVHGWGPAFFTKFLSFADPANQVDSSMRRSPALILDRWTAQAADSSLPVDYRHRVSRRRPLGMYSSSGWTTTQYAYYLAYVDALTQVSPFNSAPYRGRALNVERALFHLFRRGDGQSA